MLHKWKLILTNWINCYFNENSKKDLPISLESLLDIISHLRENLNLDESKSSVLDAHTVQDFLREKYPNFKFENRTVEPSNEEDICLAASLLLFFVCVNSKNVDIKSAMCSKLSPGDQEIILKFSKTLMECSHITYLDVLAAITEACGQEIAAAEPSATRITVAETPPAIRSYHSEVRRLQAALDAERFDRTYLQDELVRTNLKVEKLLKDKEQYKLDIVDLKAKISLCCGDENEARTEDVRASNTSKLMKQLEQVEEQLLTAQGQLEDAQYEQENYKSKLNALKAEHDKLRALNEQEMARAGCLAEELEAERRHTQTLRELVAELRQHNHLNRMDSSLLECDDPDASLHSPHHNSSVCSEVCANVIEVQLGEERAKIVTLKQQLQVLQDQICEVNRKAEEDRQSLLEIMSDKENTIMNLKHRVNEEIEEKNTLKLIFQDDVSKLNNELNELEQRLKGSQENSRQIIDKKMQEIQKLQEEKLSLLQSLSDETTKLENVIQDLRHEIDVEKQSKLKLREEYDCHIMKLNEKVMNRSNELVELQNKILEKGEVIEHLQIELQKEKQKKEEISDKLNDDIMQLNIIREKVEESLQRKSEESRELNSQLQHCDVVIGQMNKDVDHLKTYISQLQEESNNLRETKQKLLVEIKNRDVQAEQIYKETENLKNLLSDEKQKLLYNLDEASATVNSLQVQLQNEIKHKMEIHNELQNSKDIHSSLSLQISRLSAEVTKLITEKGENDIMVQKLNEQLLEEKKSNETLKYNLEETHEKIEQITKVIIEKDALITDMKNEFKKLLSTEKELNEKYESLVQLKHDNEALISQLSSELSEERRVRETIAKEVELKNVTIHELGIKLQEACRNGELIAESLRTENEKMIKEKDEVMYQFKKDKDALIKQLRHDLIEEGQKRQKEATTMSEEIEKMLSKSGQELENKDKHMAEMTREKDFVINQLRNELTEEKNIKMKETHSLKEQLKMSLAKTETILKDKDEMMYLSIQEKDKLIEELRNNLLEERNVLDINMQAVKLKDTELRELKRKLEQECRSGADIVEVLRKENVTNMNEKDECISKLIQEKDVLSQLNNELLVEKEINLKEIKKLLDDIKILQTNLTEQHEIFAQLRQETDTIIGQLNTDLNKETKNLEVNIKDMKLKDIMLDDLRHQLEEACKSRTDAMEILKVLRKEHERDLQEKDACMIHLKEEKDELINKISEEVEQLSVELKRSEMELKQKDEVIAYLKQEKDEMIDQLMQKNENNLKEKEDFIAELKQENGKIICQLRNELFEENEKVISLSQQVTNWKKDIKEKDELLDNLRQEKDKILSELRINLNEERKARDMILKEIELKDATLLDLRQKLEELCKNGSDSIKLLIEQHEKNLTEKDDLTNQLRQDLMNEKQKRQNDIYTLTNEFKKTLAESEEDIKERHELTVQLQQEKDAKISKLNKELIELNETRQNEIDKFSNEINKYENDLKEKDKLLDQLKLEKDMIISQLSEDLIKERKAREILVNELQKDIEQKDTALYELRQKLEEELKSGTDSVKRLEAENQKCLKEQDELMVKLIHERDSRISKLTQELNEGREQKHKLDTVLEDMEKSLAINEDLLKQNNKIIAQLKQENNELIRKFNDLNEEQETRQHEIKLLSEALENSEKDLSERHELIAQLMQEKDVLISKLNQVLTEETEQRQKEMDISKEVKMSLQKTQKDLLEKDEALAQLRKEKNSLLNEVIEEKEKSLKEIEILSEAVKNSLKNLKDKDELLAQLRQEKDTLISKLSEELAEERELGQKKMHMVSDDVKKSLARTQMELKEMDKVTSQLKQEKDAFISKLSKELIEEREVREMYQKEAELNGAALYELREKLDEVCRSETDSVKLLRKENEVLRKTLAMKDTFAVANQEKSSPKNATQDAGVHDVHHQVDNTPTDNTHSSLESCKTISDLERIVQDKNRTITSLQSDITYLKSLMAESENKLLDVSKDLEGTKEHCQQLSIQLKKIVYQKNEEIAELKRQVTKMSVTENRATQIIKVSAKYHAIILKRIAEIKSNTVLKELTNFGNSANCDNEQRRSLSAGTVTMEDLENFLDTTDRHLRRCSEKQLALQKERDRLTEVNIINESEIINMKKFLTELSLTIKTFNSVKEVYSHKLSRVVSLQRTVRREILSLDGQITDAAMCKLERGYAAVIQDLSECTMNFERWVERCIGRAVSAEKIKQAFTSDDRTSLASTTFQNTSLEVQLEELESSFCKLLEEVARAQKGEGAKDAQAVTVMEIRAEYEDKLCRMKAKMRELYKEEKDMLMKKQREDLVSLEQELRRTRQKLADSSRAYEEHIRTLSTELWNMGERFLMKQDEAEWLRRKQKSGSLMSLQHVHSSGLMPTQEEPSRPSDTHSLRSLPVTSNTSKKAEGRGLHMSDEEGEVFDNRWLRELARTPRRAPPAPPGPPAQRLSELQRRNSLCPPHLKSSYPAETQFVPAVQEDDIKCPGGSKMSLGGKQQRKEVGIIAYKKPGPPTPSKQAGRLSATDSELRESMRVETEPNASRKTGTPSRIRSLFRSNKTDTEGTPRSRRLSNIFKKK